MSPPVTWHSVPQVEAIDRRDFYGAFVAQRRPVVLRGLTSGWQARGWDLDNLGDRLGPLGRTTDLAVKQGDVADGHREAITFSAYLRSLTTYETRVRLGEQPERPGYLHDVPFFQVFPALTPDVEPFPAHLLPRWYRPNWHDHVQFFLGPTGSVTPLHFDTLLTNNLFFHLAGRKRFILIPAEQRDLCYLRSWRWANFDPSTPDYEAFPMAAGTTPVAISLEPGEALYIPPGTLHHVTSLSLSISFNIDWHTTRTALQGMSTVFRGAPWKNGYYNLLSFLGVGLHIPARWLFPLYRSYLRYVS